MLDIFWRAQARIWDLVKDWHLTPYERERGCDFVPGAGAKACRQRDLAALRAAWRANERRWQPFWSEVERYEKSGRTFMRSEDTSALAPMYRCQVRSAPLPRHAQPAPTSLWTVEPCWGCDDWQEVIASFKHAEGLDLQEAEALAAERHQRMREEAVRAVHAIGAMRTAAVATMLPPLRTTYYPLVWPRCDALMMRRARHLLATAPQ
eukprot:COSAG01_NODE_7394_length_3225_cov_27.121241_2_plen_207_part_00